MKLKYEIEKELVKLFKSNKLKHCIIIVLYRGKKLPPYCTPMVRNPQPKTDILLNNNFSKIYFSTHRINPSIEDGAILIEIGPNSLTLKGFSYRLFPPPLNSFHNENKGSGYNSALDFSSVKRVECVYYVNREGVRKFIKGKEKKLC